MEFGGVCPKVRKARNYYDYRTISTIDKIDINTLWELKFLSKTDTINFLYENLLKFTTGVEIYLKILTEDELYPRRRPGAIKYLTTIDTLTGLYRNKIDKVISFNYKIHFYYI